MNEDLGEPLNEEEREGGRIATAAGAAVSAVIATAEREGAELRSSADADAEAVRRRADDEAKTALDDARREAERFAAERADRLLELRSEIAERADRVLGVLAEPLEAREAIAECLAQLELAAGRLRAGIAEEGAPASKEAEAPPEDARAPFPEGAPMMRRPPREGEDLDDIDIRLAALRLSVAGLDREQAEAELRTAFAGRDLEPALEELFGPVDSSV